MTKIYKTIISLCFILLVSTSNTFSAVPITTDSRIKTFVYNENEVYHIVVHYGYQSSIEFANNEEVETMSVGNSYSWKITPLGRRIFIKPIEGGAFTNMTVITNKHTYQFDLESRIPDEGLDENLVYVVRFFYPDKSFDTPQPKISTRKFLPSAISQKPVYNFNYTLSGPDSIAPVKVFDDGQKTYLEFPNDNAIVPHIFLVMPDGSEVQSTYAREDKYITIKKVTGKITLRLGNDVVNIFNENTGGVR